MNRRSRICAGSRARGWDELNDAPFDGDAVECGISAAAVGSSKKPEVKLIRMEESDDHGSGWM